MPDHDSIPIKDLRSRRQFLRDLSSATLVFSGVLPLLGSGCKGGGDDDTGEDDVFYFAVITDLHLKADPEHPNNQNLAETVEILNGFEVPIDFVLLGGDLVDELPSEDPAFYDTYDGTALHRLAELLDGFEMPVYPVLGNHDYFVEGPGFENQLVEDRAARETLFTEFLGLPGLWYAVEHRGFSVYCLNSMQADARVTWEPDRVGSFGEAQLTWLETELESETPCFLILHHPLALDNAVEAGLAFMFPFEVPRAEGNYAKYQGTEFEDWTDPIYSLLKAHASHILGIFVGHAHWFVQDAFEGIPVLNTDSMGNSIQRTAIEVDGEEQPMRYHIAECNLTRGTFAVYNLDWFEYNQ